VFKYSEKYEKSSFWRGTASITDLTSLLKRFLGEQNTDKALSDYAASHNINWKEGLTADADMVSYAENCWQGL